MTLLLTSVFVFYGIHSILWLQRSIAGYLRGEFKEAKHGDGTWVMRFDLTTRIVHGFIMVSFLSLAFTGLPIHFHYTQWAQSLVRFFGGIETFRFFHRVFAIVTFGYATYHLTYLIYRIILKRQIRLLYGPLSLVPRLKDFQDLYHQVRWFLYLGKPAKLDRWSYWEKFDYFAVFWGVPVIGVSGLMLWFPRFFTKFLPGYVLNIAQIVHSEEALLAVGFIFIFHFFHTHLRPEAFPMDLVIFTGSMPLERFKKERPDEYKRLHENGELEKYLTDPPSPKLIRFSYIVGFLGLFSGVAMVIAIFVSILS
jgi:cytochrome b subunit of formate dehydrogenase